MHAHTLIAIELKGRLPISPISVLSSVHILPFSRFSRFVTIRLSLHLYIVCEIV